MHKLTTHPDNPMEFQPKDRSRKDLVMNMIAEQNLDIHEDVIAIKEGFKCAFEQLATDMQSYMD